MTTTKAARYRSSNAAAASTTIPHESRTTATGVVPYSATRSCRTGGCSAALGPSAPSLSSPSPTLGTTSISPWPNSTRCRLQTRLQTTAKPSTWGMMCYASTRSTRRYDPHVSAPGFPSTGVQTAGLGVGSRSGSHACLRRSGAPDHEAPSEAQRTIGFCGAGSISSVVSLKWRSHGSLSPGCPRWRPSTCTAPGPGFRSSM